MSLSFKAEKKGKKKSEKNKIEDDLQREKNPEYCDTRTDEIRRNFYKSSSREINL